MLFDFLLADGVLLYQFFFLVPNSVKSLEKMLTLQSVLLTFYEQLFIAVLQHRYIVVIVSNYLLKS
jgi:hypothetical protein